MRALPYIGVLLLWGLTVAGVVFVVDRALGFGDALIEKTRTPIPGQRTMHLDGRKYNVFFEARDIAYPDRLGDRLAELERSPLHIRIREQGSDGLLELKSYSADFTTSTSSRDSTAFATVHIPHEGDYRVSVASSDDLSYTDPTIALGEPIGGRVAGVVGAAILAAMAFIGGLGLLIATLVLRSRRRA